MILGSWENGVEAKQQVNWRHDMMHDDGKVYKEYGAGKMSREQEAKETS